MLHVWNAHLRRKQAVVLLSVMQKRVSRCLFLRRIKYIYGAVWRTVYVKKVAAAFKPNNSVQLCDCEQVTSHEFLIRLRIQAGHTGISVVKIMTPMGWWWRREEVEKEEGKSKELKRKRVMQENLRRQDDLNHLNLTMNSDQHIYIYIYACFTQY